MTKLEKLARSLHRWYLEACRKISPASYNQNAQKNYDDLSDEQKYIDLYVSKKILEEYTRKKGKKVSVYINGQKFKEPKKYTFEYWTECFYGEEDKKEG